MVRHRLASASHVSPPNSSTPRPKAGSFFIPRRFGLALGLAPFPGRRRMLRLVAVLISGMLSVPALAEQRVALVIGNDSYSNVPVLQKAAADARTMTASLS